MNASKSISNNLLLARLFICGPRTLWLCLEEDPDPNLSGSTKLGEKAGELLGSLSFVRGGRLSYVAIISWSIPATLLHSGRSSTHFSFARLSPG